MEIIEGPAMGQHGRVPIPGKSHQITPKCGRRAQATTRAKSPLQSHARAAGRVRAPAEAVVFVAITRGPASEAAPADAVRAGPRRPASRRPGCTERGFRHVFQPGVNLDARHIRISKMRGVAEIGEGPDEDNRAAGKEAGLDQGQGDFSETTEARAARFCAASSIAGIDIGEGGDGIEINQGIEERASTSATPQNWFAAIQSKVQPRGSSCRATSRAFRAPY